MNSNSRDRNRNLINFPKTKKLTREQRANETRISSKKAESDRSQPQTFCGDAPLSMPQNQKTIPPNQIQLANTREPKHRACNAPPPPLETSLNPCPSPPPKSQPLLAPLQAVTKPFHKLVSQRIRGGKKYFSTEKRVYHGFLHLRPPLFTALNFRKQINPRIPVEL